MSVCWLVSIGDGQNEFTRWTSKWMNEYCQMEEERKIVSQSVQASEKLNAAPRKDCCSVCRGDELCIHSSPGELTFTICTVFLSHCQYIQQYCSFSLAYDWNMWVHIILLNPEWHPHIQKTSPNAGNSHHSHIAVEPLKTSHRYQNMISGTCNPWRCMQTVLIALQCVIPY